MSLIVTIQKKKNLKIMEHDNLINYIVAYKLKHYNKHDYDSNGILLNYNSIKNNYNFIKFVFECNYFENQKKYNIRLKYLSKLVEIDIENLEKYIKNLQEYSL